MGQETVIWTDLETGGLKPELHDVTQVAMLLDVGGELKDGVNLLLRPDPARVEASALAVQKKTLEQVLAHPLTQRQGYDAVRAQLESWGAKDAVFGGQNCPFDADFLKELFRRNGDEGGLRRYFGGRTYDTRTMADAMRRTGALRAPNSKLGTICAAVGVQLSADKAHDAREDILATRLVFYELLKRGRVAA